MNKFILITSILVNSAMVGKLLNFSYIVLNVFGLTRVIFSILIMAVLNLFIVIVKYCLKSLVNMIRNLVNSILPSVIEALKKSRTYNEKNSLVPPCLLLLEQTLSMLPKQVFLWKK